MRGYDVEARVFVPAGIFGHDIEAFEVLGAVKESVVAEKRSGEIQTFVLAVYQRHRRAVTLIVVHADFDRRLRGNAVASLECYISGRGKVSFAHVIEPLVEINVLDHFGLEKMQVCVSLAVGVADHVDGHAVDRYVDVGSVVEVKSSQKHLFGLAAAGMLGYEKAGNGPQDFL
jgi:hypothetical protein